MPPSKIRWEVGGLCMMIMLVMIVFLLPLVDVKLRTVAPWLKIHSIAAAIAPLLPRQPYQQLLRPLLHLLSLFLFFFPLFHFFFPLLLCPFHFLFFEFHGFPKTVWFVISLFFEFDPSHKTVWIVISPWFWQRPLWCGLCSWLQLLWLQLLWLRGHGCDSNRDSSCERSSLIQNGYSADAVFMMIMMSSPSPITIRCLSASADVHCGCPSLEWPSRGHAYTQCTHPCVPEVQCGSPKPREGNHFIILIIG